MLDHILGRPSTRFRKYQVFCVVLLWSFYLAKFPRHGPPGVRRLSKWLSTRFTMHQAVVVSCVGLYVSRNFARVVGLESPEPLANLYERSFFRATWVTTALDAGFWTAMHLRPKFVRSICEIVFTVYYLVCAEQADEMVKRVRGDLSLDHLRVSWNKPNTPILRFVTKLLRPKLMNWPARRIEIPRPKGSDYTRPTEAWIYFEGSREELLHQDRVILDIPGGGFVAMDPKCHDDKLLAWGAKAKCPVVALNYGKAPEFPYPYALYECYDAYYQIIATRGKCIGLSGEVVPRIIVSGDSAGGNLAIAMTLLLLDSDSQHSSWQPGSKGKNLLPPPEAICAIYPALEMNIGNWMTDEQLALLRRPQQRKENKDLLRRKSEDYRRLTPSTPYASDDEDDSDATVKPTQKPVLERRPTSSQSNRKPTTRLAMSSMISYFNDRILSPEMLRAMILLYIGEHNKPDFATDYFLSPLRAPEELLSKFPRTFLLCGERDPLVDDTAIFAGRLRQAHSLEFKRRQELGLEHEDARFAPNKHVEVHFVPGVSHGFLQFVSVYPAGWQYIHKCARWMRDLFDENDKSFEPASSVASNGAPGSSDYFSYAPSPRSRRNSLSEDSKPLEIPSKLRMTSITSNSSSGSSHRRRGSSTTATTTTSGSGATRSRGRVQRSHSGRKSPAEARHFMISRLSSTEDLVSRRMNGVTQNLGMDSKKEAPGG
ncbi:hypothetical protein M409DRAFT_64819 [Zasmidium cellare ATCC 36951]|uniref:Alpha/beta hydrolase fold-3 domain-containing protein n=1 Tax=Zasmidium cellare ATCC 36951 TaxID=1080233 RepID=A0A6A6CUG1_ZASCE|nr:uncharacterized protein M409DRAFT_64819 [Zasmidium cellare ATCC 36951]KAF2169818.1 hypothetical protein M409DRAFT_64819 [Zasmidium cellare ATCC 36951]